MSVARNDLPMHIADQLLPVSVLGGQCEWLPIPRALGEWCVAAVRHWSFLFQNFLCIVGGNHQGLFKKSQQCIFRKQSAYSENNHNSVLHLGIQV